MFEGGKKCASNIENKKKFLTKSCVKIRKGMKNKYAREETFFLKNWGETVFCDLRENF